MTSKKQAKKPIGLKKLFKERSRTNVLAFLVILLSLGTVGLLEVVRPRRLPEIFEITGANQAYFEIEADNLIPGAGNPVNIDIYLTTSGQDFDAAVALVEWDANVFTYSSAVGALSAQFLSSFVADNQGRRALTHFAPSGDSPMNIASGQRTKFATLTLTANVISPNTTVRLSTAPGDVVVHFVNAAIDNSVDQSLADQSKLTIRFGGGEKIYLLEPQPSGNIEMPVSGPIDGYGINALLKDEHGNIIIDQSDFYYMWSIADPSIATVSASSFSSGCPYGIQSPCPNLHADIQGKKPGATTITAKAYKISLQKHVATAVFNLVVTPSLGPKTVNFKVKFQGIDSKPAIQVSQDIKIQLINNNKSLSGHDFFGSGDNGVYTSLNGVSLPSDYFVNPVYKVLVKGPKHRQMRFNNVDISSLEVDLAFKDLEAGDLPDPASGQDGQVDAYDMALVEQRLGSTKTEDLIVADIDLNGIINAGDIHYIHDTLSTKKDEY